MFDIFLQNMNAQSPMLVTLSGIVTGLFVAKHVIILVMFLSYNIPSLNVKYSFFGSTYILDNFVQLQKTPLPILDTFLGIVIFVKLLQPSNA